MKILLQLARTIEISTADIDPDNIKSAIQELELYTDENGDEYKSQSDLSKEEWEDIIKFLLLDDISTVCDVESEIDAEDFQIEVLPEETKAP